MTTFNGNLTVFNRTGAPRRTWPGGWILTAFLMVSTWGCNANPTGMISGKVLYNGQPLPGGIVTFLTEDNHSVSAPIQEDGTYEVAKVPVGSATICVETEFLNVVLPSSQPGLGGGPKKRQHKEKGLIIPERMKGRVPDEMVEPEETPVTGKYVKIPKKFTDPKKSGLTYTVQDGKQVHDIELK